MKKDSGDIKGFIIDHYQYAAVGVLFIILIIVLVIFAAGRNTTRGDSSLTRTSENTAKDSLGTGEIEVPDDKIEQNAYEEINSFFTSYYQAVAEGNIDALSAMGVVIDAEEAARIKVKAGYTEDYENMSCYTKPGPEDDSYIVFVYYEIKFRSIDTLAPGLSTFYLCTDNDGEYYLKDIGSLPQNMKDYIKAIANQADVQSLLTEVDTLYSTNTDSDPTLKAFMASLQTETEAAAAKAVAGGSDSSSSGSDVASSAMEVRVTTTDAVNIRETPDTNGNKVGSAAKGDSFVRIDESDGWSKIRYKDGEAYIKSEFLTTQVGDTVVAAGTVVTNGDTNSDETTQSTPQPDNSSNTSSASGSITVSEAVSIRSEASTDSQKLGSAYKGDKFKLYEEANGWYRIDYNGQTGYIKSDYASKN